MLDGVRAGAYIWVMSLHLGGVWPMHYICQADLWPFWQINNGDLAVDVFVVLSGFLIAYILLKEAQKY